MHDKFMPISDERRREATVVKKQFGSDVEMGAEAKEVPAMTINAKREKETRNWRIRERKSVQFKGFIP
jgi:hypothetical protein